MIKIAVIPAAGYKCTAERYYDTKFTGRYVPESLMPIGRGQTVLSRLCSQLRNLGFLIFIGVGEVGSIYPGRVFGLARKHGIKQDVTVSPWTWNRILQVREDGMPIFVHEPDGWRGARTVAEMLRAIGLQWDRALVVCGDYLYSDALIKAMVHGPWPSRNKLGRRHAVWLLTPAVAGSFLWQTEKCREHTPNIISVELYGGDKWDDLWSHQGLPLMTPKTVSKAHFRECLEMEASQGLDKAVAFAKKYPHAYKGRRAYNPAVTLTLGEEHTL